MDYPLRGGRGFTKNVPIRLVQEFGVSEETAKHLARTYGVHAFDVCKLSQPTGKSWPRFGKRLLEGYPYLECEVEYACQEYVRTVADMLTLRFRLAFLNSEAALAVAPKVADLMAAQLHWDVAERDRQLAEAENLLGEFGGPIPNMNVHEAVQFSAATVTDLSSLFSLLDLDRNGYIDFPEMKFAAKSLGFPFDDEDSATLAFSQMDKHHDGRISEEDFIEWWTSWGPDDELRRKLSENMKFSLGKTASDPSRARGVMFG